MDLSYIRKVNGMHGKSSVRDSVISEIVNDYNEALDNLITDFSVKILSNKAKNVTLNNILIKCLIENTVSKDDENKEQRIIKTKLDTDMERGNLVIDEDNVTYMVFSDVDKEDDHKRAKLRKCNQTINSKLFSEPIPCIADNTAYFTKGSIQGDFFIENDAKLKMYLPRTEQTEKIYPGMRFIFEHKACYEVTSEDVVVLGGLVALTLVRSTTQPEDDLENNIAFNPELDRVIPDKIPTFAEIQGENPIKLGQEYEYRISPHAEWSVSDDSIAEIVRIEGDSCFVVGKKVNYFKLIATINNEEYIKNVVVRK